MGQKREFPISDAEAGIFRIAAKVAVAYCRHLTEIKDATLGPHQKSCHEDAPLVSIHKIECGHNPLIAA
ncbi:hypothetical protein [Pseudoprimorskyibacter insulae]|uniref:Uncharacterized protein n=1 Tax=Pseudoprimorskyibacter insulae TaxID=1695997 RepID=A0A2R8AXY4_9RHOB|nr:hypothetical protein [Pseudoprimorskyibacter insulae]SPF80719.1 hypothetical protein PRI8871_02530 [Pseudoprimorskyibacter insulae]